MAVIQTMLSNLSCHLLDKHMKQSFPSVITPNSFHRAWFSVLGFLHHLSQLSKDRFEYVSFTLVICFIFWFFLATFLAQQMAHYCLVLAMHLLLSHVFFISSSAFFLANYSQTHPYPSTLPPSHDIPHLMWFDGNLHSSRSLPRFEYVRFYGS